MNTEPKSEQQGTRYEEARDQSETELPVRPRLLNEERKAKLERENTNTKVRLARDERQKYNA